MQDLQKLPIFDEQQKTFSQIAEKLQSQTTEEAKQQEVIKKIEAINTTSATTEQNQSLETLKTELPSKSTPQEKTNILAQFFAKKENQALKTLVEEELKKPAEGEGKSTAQQERIDYFNKSIIIAKLTSEEYTTQEKQQVLVGLLLDPAKEKQSAQLEKILEEIKKEAEDKKQEARVDHLQEIYSQTERVKAFTQYYIEQDTSVSQKELQDLQKLPIFDEQQKTKIEEFVKLQESLKLANINIDQLDAPEIQENLTEQQKKIVEDYLIKKQEISEIAVDVIIQDERIEQQLSSTPREEIESQKKQFETILKLMGVKYKSDRNKALNFIFGETAEMPTDIKTKLDKMYTSLEKPLTMMNKKEDILEKIIVSINSEIEEKEPFVRTAKEELTLQKNKNTLTRIQIKKQSLGALLARIKKAIEKSS